MRPRTSSCVQYTYALAKNIAKEQHETFVFTSKEEMRQDIAIDVHQEFIQAMMLWICDGNAPGTGKSVTKELKNGGEVHFEITLKQLKDIEPF